MKNTIIRSFLIRFFSFFIVAHLLFVVLPFFFFQEWLASLMGTLLGLFFSGTLVSVNGSLFEITLFCTGISSIAIIGGLFYGFDTHQTRSQKIMLFIGGALGLSVINILRIIVILLSANHSLELAEVAHTISWFIMSGVGVYYWVLVTRRSGETINGLARRLLRGK